MEGNNGQDAGTAPPFQMSRHSHPKARPGLIDTAHRSELADKVNYVATRRTSVIYMVGVATGLTGGAASRPSGGR
ncbi:hypothetical protein HET69_08175 [Streptomyces sp. CJ_13]|uniref:hypothetical protein n=1 Tax=Streptomyces sp. CJ_13 TaxID=2724943 RepID=UPI001BDD3915|nr:hypothetical protein [Streptomyces sp. CJ_13]MBT1183992.1 hypothetical protein [Streptomyces sp. CJ_13]